jgi:hypothetical protein
MDRLSEKETGGRERQKDLISLRVIVRRLPLYLGTPKGAPKHCGVHSVHS